MLTGRNMLLIGAAFGAVLTYLTVTGRLRNSETAKEREAMRISHSSGGLLDGLLSSWSMILVSEIGDKTFFIACLMAMRHPRATVFAGAIAALVVQTVLSCAMGSIVPLLLPPLYTQMAAVVLFALFGLKLLREARAHPDESDSEPDEMQEAADEIRKGEEEYGPEVVGQADVEGISGTASRRDSASTRVPTPPPAQAAPHGAAEAEQPSRRAHRRTLLCCSPVLLQAFSLTFIAEWGDRSQLATIALAAAKNPFGVCIGGIVGHSICTGAAVIIGQKVAHILSPQQVTLIGGLLFIFFALLTLWGLLYPESEHRALPPADSAEVGVVLQGLRRGGGPAAADRAIALIERLSAARAH
eukprot:TRINITY_DN12625_c0_g1_i1.p1 TRINITY_DN12625_c0_g1~~TRINITY_DN12625_c0_g1_i1.p1  ORF type:complete len:387 (+),score=132.13 TRINITY_DN12625_c0_g1_i1:93-1163(+)